MGSTRQDINISIKGGKRIEIKGVQKLDWIPGLVKFEILRQQGLISVKNKLETQEPKVIPIVRPKNNWTQFTGWAAALVVGSVLIWSIVHRSV